MTSSGLESMSLSEQQLIHELQISKNRESAQEMSKKGYMGSDEKMEYSESSENPPAISYNESEMKNETLRVKKLDLRNKNPNSTNEIQFHT